MQRPFQDPLQNDATNGCSAGAARIRARAFRGLVRASAGFTILEVVAATIVMAIVFASSLTAMHRGFISIDSARNETLAGQVMQNELERIRLEDWATVSSYVATTTVLSPDPAFNSASSLVGRFTLTRTVNLVKTDMVQITVMASWTGTDGRAQSRSYTTFYAKHGLYDFFANATS